MKKVLGILLSITLIAALLAGCGAQAADEPAEATNDSTETVADTDTGAGSGSFTAASPITVVSREDGSGTRGAFIELVGVEEKNADGEKMDMTTDEAVVVSSTSVVMTTVAGDAHAIGYISLGSLDDSVKALAIDGAPATVAAIKDGSYAIARPFNLAVTDDVSDAAQDFINYIMSSEGQAVVEDNGYISSDDAAAAYEASGASGKVVVAGSSSVNPVMEKLKEAYAAVNADVEIEIQMSDSSTGMSSAIEGICDIGMASRELKDSELDEGLVPIVMAMDGIAIIVNNDNPNDGLSSEVVKGIYTGEIESWSEV